jgi:predicted peroxiredoxin
MSIVINMDKAKVITKDRLRKEREPEFQKLDIAFQRAQETGQDTTAIVAAKERLRDITKLVDIAQTPEELKAINV